MTVNTRHERLFEQVDFDPAVHTIDRLGEDLSDLSERYPDMRVGGSLGRSAFYEQAGFGYGHEFHSRGQDVLHKQLSRTRSVARDIDVACLTEAATDIAFPVDRSAFNGQQASFVRENDQWWLVSAKHRFAEELEPEVMGEYQGRIRDHRFSAFPPATSYATLAILGNARTSKIAAIGKVFGKALEAEGVRVDGDELAPFYQLGALNRDDPVNRVRRQYRHYVPGQVREFVLPITRAITRNLG